MTEGFWGRLLLQAFFLFPEAAVGNKQAGGGRAGAAARDARVLWKGSGKKRIPGSVDGNALN